MEEKILLIRLLCFSIFILIAICGVLIGYAYSTNRRNERLEVINDRKTEIICEQNALIDEMRREREL